MKKLKAYVVALVLFLILLVLKLLQVGFVADWPWWLVTFLLWGPWAMAIVMVFIEAIFKNNGHGNQ